MASASRILFLLPRLPSPLTLATTKAAYGSAFTSVLSTLSSRARSSRQICRMDIALSWSHTSGNQPPRGLIFNNAQKSLAMVYRLICIVAAKESITLDGPNGIDARVFFLDTTHLDDSSTRTGHASRTLEGPIIDLPTLALSDRQWSEVFAIESEEGETLVQDFLKQYDSRPGFPQRPTVRRVIGGIKIVAANGPLTTTASRKTSTRHYSVAVGGTFDHLHAGHKLLLVATALVVDPGVKSAAPIRRTLTVGITGEELLTSKKYAEVMESWDERQGRVADFLESILAFGPSGALSRSVERVSNPGPNETYVRVSMGDLIINYVQISDPYGPTITDQAISALVISQETRSGGRAVNDKRIEKGWSPLEVFEVDILDSTEVGDATEEADRQDFQDKISSTEIRRQRLEARA